MSLPHLMQSTSGTSEPDQAPRQLVIAVDIGATTGAMSFPDIDNGDSLIIFFRTS
jgi:hypothetical protein